MKAKFLKKEIILIVLSLLFSNILVGCSINTPLTDSHNKKNSSISQDEEKEISKDSSTEKVIGKVELYEGTYLNDNNFGDKILTTFCEVVISNVTDTSFDFTVYQVDAKTRDKEVIFHTNTAVFTGDGTKATFYGKNYTLDFTFPDDHGTYPVVTDMEISGFEPLEGKTFVNQDEEKEISKASSAEKVIGQVELYEGTYFDDNNFGDKILTTFCEVVISNVTDTSFDFTVYQVDAETRDKEVIFRTNTAFFIGDGTKAAFYGKNYTLDFTFPDYHGAYPIVTDMEISGFEPLEGKTFVNNGIPGHEFC